MPNYKMKNMIGEKLGSLEIIGLSETELTKKGTRKWICKCECGNIVYYETRVWNDLKKRVPNTSCGCRHYGGTRVGECYGDLVIIKENTNREEIGTREWVCKCKYCGEEKILKTGYLWRYKNYKCSYLLKLESKQKKRIARTLQRMKQRCYDIDCVDYKNYGARGITICDEWLDKENGLSNFREWSLKNGYADNLSIDRIDNNKSYSPDNCRWVDSYIQNNNKRSNRIITYMGKTQVLKQWCRELNLPYRKTHKRLYMYGWSVERAFTTK